MKALTDDVTRTWDAFQTAVAALQRYARDRRVEGAKTTKANPRKLALVEAFVDDTMRANPDQQWNTWSLAVELVNSSIPEMQVKTLQNVYLPALRATSPHCIRSGRQWLWFYNAADGTGSRDAKNGEFS